MKYQPLIHLSCLAVFPVVFLVSQNTDEIRFADIIMPLLVILSCSAVVFALLCAVFRDSAKAATLTSLALVLFFSYGHIFEPKPGAYWTHHRYLLAAWTIIFLAAAYVLLRTKRSLQPVTKTLNGISIILVAVSLGQIAAYQYAVAGSGSAKPQDISPPGMHLSADAAPDIYYIILDAYASKEVLSELGHDNDAFVTYLTDKGFYVVPNSYSNYSSTDFSLSSSLNMDYLENLTVPRGVVSAETLRHQSLIENNAVQRLVRSQGYRFIHVGSHWHATYKNRNADENIAFGYLPEFATILYKTTVLYPVGKKLNIFDDRKIQYQRILYNFEHLSEIPQRADKTPVFVFAHLITPHPPFVFDRDGAFLPDEQQGTEQIQQAYIDQVVFVNGKLKQLVDDILTHSARPPIIILQGDHGSRLEDKTKVHTPEDVYDWYIRERLGNLNAYYLPDGAARYLYPTITPVNSFRFIFNRYFGAEFALLPDRIYLAPPWGTGHDLIDVTNRVR